MRIVSMMVESIESAIMLVLIQKKPLFHLIYRKDYQNMFTIADIRDIAIQIERNGEAAYLQAGEMVEDPELRRLLRTMAGQEKEHAHWFEQMQLPLDPERQNPQIAEMGRELLQTITAKQTFSLEAERLIAAEDICAVLQQSREFERDTILFYEMLYDYLEEGEVARRQLIKIIEEEKIHIKHLEKMAAQLGRSKQNCKQNMDRS
jgi:rubrerythrin